MNQFVVSINNASVNMQTSCCVAHQCNNVALLDPDWGLSSKDKVWFNLQPSMQHILKMELGKE